MAEPKDAPLARVVLDEWSGPVAPRFQYSFHVEIARAAGGGATVSVRHKTPKGVFEGEGALSAARFAELSRDLVAHVPLGADRDLVGARRDRKGVSFNRLALAGDAARTTVDYLLTDVDDENEDVAAAIRVLKALALEVESSGVGAPS